MQACSSQFIDVVKLLLEAGVDIEAPDEVSVEHNIVRFTSITFLWYMLQFFKFLQYYMAYKPCCWSCSNIIELCQLKRHLILEYFFSVKVIYLFYQIGRTALVQAVWSRDVNIVKLLLEVGANTEARTNVSDTHCALSCSSVIRMVVLIVTYICCTRCAHHDKLVICFASFFDFAHIIFLNRDNSWLLISFTQMTGWRHAAHEGSRMGVTFHVYSIEIAVHEGSWIEVGLW